nr:DegT/DnrJ/EryC1/StrS family aminotransferase [Lachnospiraceae bacterium]
MENKILVTRPSIPEMDEYINEIKSIWDCMWITNSGPKHEKFKKELSEYLGVSGIEIFTNGHMALELSFKALGIESGEVITSPFTFVSTTHAIVRSGLTPVFCDIDPIDMTIDPDKIEALITDKTVAIM